MALADRTTLGSAVAGSGAANSLPTGQSAAAAILAASKLVWQAGYAGALNLKSGSLPPVPVRGAETESRSLEGYPARRSRWSRSGLVCLARSAAAPQPLERSACGEAATTKPLAAGTIVRGTGRKGQ